MKASSSSYLSATTTVFLLFTVGLLIVSTLIPVAVGSERPRRLRRIRKPPTTTIRNDNGGGGPQCIHSVPSADTHYVAALNPGIPITDHVDQEHPHVINVLVVYTEAARVLRGGSSATMVSDAETMVERTNAIYLASEVPAKLNLAYVTEASDGYAEGTTILDDLNRVTDGSDGHLDQVHSLRQCVGADLVILLTSPQARGQSDASTVIGAAWFRTNSPAFDGTGFAPFAFAVVRYNILSSSSPDTIVAVTSQTFAHEIGHIAGCLHDIGSHSASELSLLRQSRALGYSFEASQQQYRTVMSANFGARRIDLHANPDVLFQGTVAGNAETGDCSAFLASDLGFVAAFVAGPNAESCPPELVGCDGKVLSGVQEDQCGICAGSNECVDCEGVVDGGKTEDCFGVCGGGAVEDCMSVCNGAAVIDCSSVCNGGHVEDCMGVCDGAAVVDCSGRCNGNAFRDDCGVCASGNTGLVPNADKDCEGVCGGGVEFDECGECGGDGSSCRPECHCPLPPEYWSLHHCFAAVPSREEPWPSLYSDCTEAVRCGGPSVLRWIDVLNTPTDHNNAWLILAKHWISARLNMANSPCLVEVTSIAQQRLIDAMDQAESLLDSIAGTQPAACSSVAVPELSGNSADGLRALSLASPISQFNERRAFSDGVCLRMSMPSDVDERCEGGCTRTGEYWKEHHIRAVSPSLRIPWPGEGGEDAEICPGETKFETLVLSRSSPTAQKDAWVVLAGQTVVADLNVLSDACVPKEAADALVFSRTLLGTQCRPDPLDGHTPVVVEQGTVLRADMFGLASILSAYNRGELGPGECGSPGTLLSSDGTWSASAPPCEGGCTHTSGYWTTHHANATTGLDGLLRKPWPKADPDNDVVPTEVTVLCGDGTVWIDIMMVTITRDDDDAWIPLAHQWISARLNTMAGACTTRSVDNAMMLGIQILETNCVDRLPADATMRNSGSRDVALEITHVLKDYNSGCGGRGPPKCQGEDDEMVVLVIDGLRATSQLEHHQQQCEEEHKDKCKSEQNKADSFLTWAVIVTILLIIIVAILLILVLWWWWKMHKSERRMRQRATTTTTTTTERSGTEQQPQSGGAAFGAVHQRRNVARPGSSPPPRSMWT